MVMMMMVMFGTTVSTCLNPTGRKAKMTRNEKTTKLSFLTLGLC